jgi:2-octaprenyl-6-methoxyphenol hydroxylase
MNICIIGAGLTSLSLAKNLINKKINVHMYHGDKIRKFPESRTIGISKNNLEFFKKEIQNISKKKVWEIKKIEIYSDKIEGENILKFENDNKNLFYMVKNNDLYNILKNKIYNNKFFKKKVIKKNFFNNLLNTNKYDLIINCETNNSLSKKYFTNKIYKNYSNFAYTTIIKHQKIQNNIATQIFTRFGPIAFLPISNNETSIVCSLNTKNKIFKDIDIVNLIHKNNPKYQIKKIFKINNFELSSSSLRTYYHKNILAFGDLLHRIHPLAGQGFNMNIRDIKTLSEIIQNKIDLGMHLDTIILNDFEVKTKNKNFLFSSGVDFIYEAFNIERQLRSKSFNKLIKIVGKNKNITNYLTTLADRGLNL